MARKAAAPVCIRSGSALDGMSGRWLLIVAARSADALVAGFRGGPVFCGSLGRRAGVASAPSISLAIMPFYNASGRFDGLAWRQPAEMLSSDIGFFAVRMVSPDRCSRCLAICT